MTHEHSKDLADQNESLNSTESVQIFKFFNRSMHGFLYEKKSIKRKSDMEAEKPAGLT